MMITMPMIITIVRGQPGQEKRLGGGGGGAGTVAAAPSTVGKVVACPRWAKTSKTARLVPAKTHRLRGQIVPTHHYIFSPGQYSECSFMLFYRIFCA